MGEPTIEQVKELWEWCGLTFEHPESNWFRIRDGNSEFVRNSGGGNIWFDGTMLMPHLNNLFKYAVPKIDLPNYKLAEIRFYPHWQGTDNWLCELTLEQYISDRFAPECCRVKAKQGATPALALLWAIREAFHIK